jgi:SAM-dependent methyltransferase
MNHVFEHVPDPITLLKECYRLLSPGGHLILAMPNLGSLGHRLFREHWLALDPPRHLCLWSAATLSRALRDTGFRVLRCITRTTGATDAEVIYCASQQIRLHGHVNLNALPARIAATVFDRLERVLGLLHPRLGEEICAVARKPRSLMASART